MAAKSRKPKPATNFDISVELKGVLTTSVRGELVVEFIKDLLYQRQQISMPYEQIKQDVAKCKKAQQKKERDGEVQLSRSLGRQSVESRKRGALVDSMTDLCKSIIQIFSLSTSVRSVLVTLGPNPVSPRETYLLRFPTLLFDGRVLSLKHCKATLFQELVSSPFFESISPPKSCTKLFVMVELLEPINDDLVLIPKPDFKIPTRGSRLELGFVCKTKIVSGDLSRVNETDFDISGVEPFNHSVLESEHSTIHKRLTSHGSQNSDVSMSNSSPGLTGSHDHLMDIDCQTPQRCASPMMCDTPALNCDDSKPADLPYSWFQIPMSVLGYREKASKKA